MDRITVFLLQFIIIGYANSENPTVQQSPSDSKFIYQASVQNSLNHHICNGVILNRNWILTLAQCVLNRNAGELKVFYGSNRLNHNGSYVDVKQIYIHPGFNKTIIRSDIALLLATTNITFIANISGSINLPAHDVPINREKLTASGWNASTTSNSDWLQYCIVKSIPSMECRKSNPLLSHIIRSWLICSVSQANICSAGDLGSALVAEDNTLYGISTMNEETYTKASINIYTNVFAQIEWIRFITTGWPW